MLCRYRDIESIGRPSGIFERLVEYIPDVVNAIEIQNGGYDE